MIKNRTFKYLVPALSHYGESFRTKLNIIRVLKIGIWDSLLEGSHLEGGKYIFFQADIRFRPELAETFINWCKNQPFYVTDYLYKEGESHMIVILFPLELEDIYLKFLQGKYSKMYTKKEIEKFFIGREEEKQVLNRALEAKARFKRLIFETFGTILEEKDFKNEVFEYDLPPNKEEETF